MKYTHITVDVGTAEKHFKALWINPDEFKDVIIYLWDFHYFMHFFFWKFIGNSGFEVTIFVIVKLVSLNSNILIVVLRAC